MSSASGFIEMVIHYQWQGGGSETVRARKDEKIENAVSRLSKYAPLQFNFKIVNSQNQPVGHKTLGFFGTIKIEVYLIPIYDEDERVRTSVRGR